MVSQHLLRSMPGNQIAFGQRDLHSSSESLPGAGFQTGKLGHHHFYLTGIRSHDIFLRAGEWYAQV